MIPLIYHPCYNITAFGLERLHPFDGRKYRRIHDALIARGLHGPGTSFDPVGSPAGTSSSSTPRNTCDRSVGRGARPHLGGAIVRRLPG